MFDYSSIIVSSRIRHFKYVIITHHHFPSENLDLGHVTCWTRKLIIPLAMSMSLPEYICRNSVINTTMQVDMFPLSQYCFQIEYITGFTFNSKYGIIRIGEARIMEKELMVKLHLLSDYYQYPYFMSSNKFL
jgi:hypothetical protein